MFLKENLFAQNKKSISLSNSIRFYIHYLNINSHQLTTVIAYLLNE